MATEQVLGAVVVDGDRRSFEGSAAGVLSGMRGRLGDDRTVDLVLEEGWSNGRIYFAEPMP